MKLHAISILAIVVSAPLSRAQTPPPAPTLIEPAAGAALVQPVNISWTEVTDPDGPIIRYDWQVSASSSFTSVIAWGFTSGSPPLLRDALSGLPNGTYFVRVNCTQPATGLESSFSSARSFTITGLGPAPTVTPIFNAPANGSQFHEVEFFDIRWTESTDAHYYLLEADDEPTFSFPHNINNTPVMLFRPSAGAGYGFSSNIFYRVRPVSADNVRGLPSPTLSVQITNAAPVPPPPTPQVPTNGAQVTVPFKFSWSPTPNPQAPGYDIHIDNDPGFAEPFVLFISDINRSDHLLDSGLAPGTYFWRVRAQHGAAIGGWSAGRSFTVVAGPPTPPGLTLASLTLSPAWLPTGFSSLGTVRLSGPAPAGGALTHIASYFPTADVASDTVLVPEGATSTSFPISTDFVEGLQVTVGYMGATYSGALRAQSLALRSLLWGTGYSADNVVGGNSVVGTLTLTAPARAGGVTAKLVSSHPAIASVPQTVFVPQGQTIATFTVMTNPVTQPVIVKIHSAAEGSQAPSPLLKVTPPGTPHVPSLSGISLSPNSVSNGNPANGTVTLSAPAPAGGVGVAFSGDTAGLIILPGTVTVLEGSVSAPFTIATSPVLADSWFPIIARHTTTNQTQAAVLELRPGPPVPPTPSSITFDPPSVVGSGLTVATLILTAPAPFGGAVVSLASSNTAIATCPSSVTLSEGATSKTFIVNTNSVSTPTQVNILATLNGVTQAGTLNVTPIPATLTSLTLNPTSVVGGASSTATVTLSAPAQAGGQAVSIFSQNPSVATVDSFEFTVPRGSTTASVPVHTVQVVASTSATIQASSGGVTHTANLIILSQASAGWSSPSAQSPDTGGDGNGFELNAANAHADDLAFATDNNSGTQSSTSCTSTARDKHRFFNYGIAVPAGSSIPGIEVRLDARADSTANSPRMCVQLSGNGGASWTATKSTATLTTTMATYTLGSPTDTWGRTWTPAELSDANFRVRIITTANSTSRDFFLDWAAVRVHQGAPPAPDTTPPTVSITSPVSGATVSGTTTISASASDNVGVTRVEFLVDGVLLSTDTTSPYSASWNTTTATNGAHSLTAQAFDAANNQTTSSAVSVTVNNAPPPTDTTPPTASITSPANGATLSGTATISANASDNVGVTRVEFLVDGAILSTDTTSPYSASWNTTTATNGTHSLTARAFDAGNNQATSTPVSVTVNNGSPPVLDITLSGVPASIRRGQFFTATGTVANTGGSTATGYTVLLSWTPSNAMRMENPQNATQSVAPVAAGGSQNVAWQMRADNTANATITMTVRNASGQTVDTVSQTFTITD